MKNTGTIAAGLVILAGLVAGCPPVTINYPQSPAGGSYTYPAGGASNFNLTGQWTSNQYQCPMGSFYTETVQITQQGQQISAVKVTGDPCVPAGYKSFEGSLSGNSGQLNCATGSAQRPASGWVSGTLSVIDANSFDACNARFVRVGRPAPGPITYPTSGVPTYQPGVKNVAPGYSPVHIWIPNNWISTNYARTNQFNMTFGDPNEEIVMGFRFLNNSYTARSDTLNVVSSLGQTILIPGTMVPSSAVQNTQINGMNAEFQEFRGQANNPGHPDHGQSVDLAVALVYAPGNRAVCVVAMGFSRHTSRHQSTTQQILTSLAPRP